MTDLRLIRHFESVFRLGSFSKAADELGLSQSALTKSIQTLEANWDVTLFHRTTRSIAATDAGKRLYPMGVDLLAHAETVKRETREGERVLNIVCGPAILDTLIQPAIEVFRETFPLTRVSAETMPPAHAVEELIQRRVHLLLYHSTTIDGLPHTRRLKTAELFSEPYVVACRPGHAVLETDRSLTSLLKFEWAIAGYDPVFESGLPKDIRDVLLASNFPKYRVLSQPACLEMTRRTDTLSSAPQSVIAPLVASGDLDVFPHPANLKFSIGAASLIETWQEPVVMGFVESLRSSCQNRLH